MGNAGSATVGGKKGGKGKHSRSKSDGSSATTAVHTHSNLNHSSNAVGNNSVFPPVANHHHNHDDLDQPARLEPAGSPFDTSSSSSSDNFDDEPSLDLSSTKNTDGELSSFRSDLTNSASIPKDDDSYRRNYLDCVKRGNLIGQGSFGKVFMGLNQVTGELLAVKQVVLEVNPDNTFAKSKELEALQQEMSILRRLRHENIVRYYGATQEGCKLNIILEYVSGGSIHSLIQKFGPLKEELVAVYTRQIVSGLEYLHRHNVIHRDIKGANLLVDNNGNVKLADFGASKRLKNIMPGGSAEKSLKGTVYWMAPEVIKQKGHGRQADIWSVGCTVIEMAVGKPPWSDIADQIAAMYHIASSNKPPPLPSGLSNEGKDFLQKCLKIEYRKRPSAAQLLEHVWIARGAAFPPRLSEDHGSRRPRSNNLPKVGTPGSGSEMPRKARSFQQEPLSRNREQVSLRESAPVPKKTKAYSEPFGPPSQGSSSRKDPSMYKNPYSYFKSPGGGAGGAPSSSAGAGGIATSTTSAAPSATSNASSAGGANHEKPSSSRGERDDHRQHRRSPSHMSSMSPPQSPGQTPVQSPCASPRDSNER